MQVAVLAVARLDARDLAIALVGDDEVAAVAPPSTSPSYQVMTGLPLYCCTRRFIAVFVASGLNQIGWPSPSTISAP